MNQNDVVGRLRLLASTRRITGPWMREWWFCHCDCGNFATIIVGHLQHAKTQSCGCLVREMLEARNTKHGKTVRGKRENLWDIWAQMRNRCRNPKCPAYVNYGGRNIQVCPEWDDYMVFRQWAYEHGYQEKARLSVERKDNNLGYNPDNCIIIPLRDQSLNQRSNIPVTLFGETKLLHHWLRDPRCTVPQSTFYHRIKRGLSPEEAFTIPRRKRIR
jgi:hypothetical protein